VGGLLAQLIGRVPIPGSSADIDGLHLVAEGVTGRRNRIDSVLVRAIEPVEEAADDTTEERQPADA